VETEEAWSVAGLLHAASAKATPAPNPTILIALFLKARRRRGWAASSRHRLFHRSRVRKGRWSPRRASPNSGFRARDNGCRSALETGGHVL
jgi:hypothetical protein